MNRLFLDRNCFSSGESMWEEEGGRGKKGSVPRLGWLIKLLGVKITPIVLYV